MSRPECYPYGEFDAMEWAKEFKSLFPESDQELMLGWFANAIMTGFDCADREYRKQPGEETPASICGWAEKTFPDSTEEGRLGKYIGECEEFGLVPTTWQDAAFVGDDGKFQGIPGDFDFSELPDKFIMLVQVMRDHYGSCDAAQEAIDKKMYENRYERTWNIGADGTGQHVGEDDAADGGAEAEGTRS